MVDIEGRPFERVTYTEGYNNRGMENDFWKRFHEIRSSVEVIPYAIRFLKGKLRSAKWGIASFIILHVYSERPGNFQLKGKQYDYLINRFNAINTERVVEIPLALGHLDSTSTKDILEIGNVISNYVKFDHDVVDKYETGNGIENLDAAEFDTEKRYDYIVSVSTIEHIGYDEEESDPGKILRTLNNLSRLLKNDGKMVITVPLAYNPTMDRIIQNNEFAFDEIHFLKRISTLNKWQQTTIGDAMSSKYGSKYPAANSIALLIYNNKLHQDLQNVRKLENDLSLRALQ